MARRPAQPETVARLPIEGLELGEVGPPLDPDHPSWDVIEPWEDPLAARGGYRVPSGKTRAECDGEPVIEWLNAPHHDRMFVVGDPAWRECAVECRVEALGRAGAPTSDQPWSRDAWVGVAARMETVRRYYFFGIANRRRLTICRRHDEEWVELAGADILLPQGPVTLRLSADGDGLAGECPELGAALSATDTSFRSGLAGFRAMGHCRLHSLRVTMTPGQRAENDRRVRENAALTAHLSSALPDEEDAGAISLAGGRSLLGSLDFCRAGRNDLLFETPNGLIAETWEGEVLWRLPEHPSEMKWSADTVDGARLLFALVGKRRDGAGKAIGVRGSPTRHVVQSEWIVVNGATGQVERRAPLPVSPFEACMRRYDLSCETGRLSGQPATDIIVREWRKDVMGGGTNLWAYDAKLNLLWHGEVSPPYGHHNAVHFFDADGDGRDETLAGGTLLSVGGEVLWTHDRAAEMGAIVGAGHYDAALIGRFADDPELDPVAFLIGGTAGVYVVDGLTGRTRAAHRIGHAQWGLPCSVRGDLPGKQAMIGTRWENYGILTLFSGRGERLWTIQPDYVLQGTCPVQWVPGGPEHIWVNTSLRGMGLYDGHGRLAKPLDKIRALYGCGTNKPTIELRRAPEGPSLLGLRVGDDLRLFGPKV